MACTVRNLRGNSLHEKIKIAIDEDRTNKVLSNTNGDDDMSNGEIDKVASEFYEENDEVASEADDDFDFLGNYDEDPVVRDEMMLPENTAASAINCGFIGIGGGGGKLAAAFLELGFNKTILINTTAKDQPGALDENNFLLIPGADGVGKDVSLGKKILEENSALVEDTLRTRLGNVDWIFVLAGGGGGTGSASYVLQESFDRYLTSTEAVGKVVYIVTKPTAQELLNPTIKLNYGALIEDIKMHPHIVVDNEKQLQLLRGRVGMLNMYPTANKTFAKLFWQLLKLASQSSPIQAFDTKDLERCLETNGRMFIGSTVVRNLEDRDLGARVFQGSIKGSPCLKPTSNPETGALLLVISSEMAANPDISKRLETAMSYVGGRTQTLLSGIYINDKVPGLIGITLFGGMK